MTRLLLRTLKGMKKTLITLGAALAMLTQTRTGAAEKPGAGSDGSALRVKAAGLGTDDWLGGKLIHGQGCTMVKLDRPSPAGYSSLLLVGISHMQAYKSGQWVEVAIAPMLKPEPAHCKAGGSD
jgi:hypothetical protein